MRYSNEFNYCHRNCILISPTKRGAETKSVWAVDQTPSCRPRDVIIIKVEVRSGSGLRETKYHVHTYSTYVV